MFRRRLRRAGPGIVLGVSLLVAGCGDQGPDRSGQPPLPVLDAGGRLVRVPTAVRARLRTEVVSLRTVPAVITAPGEVALDPNQVAKIASRIEGQVERVYVRLGDRVRPGQALAAIGSLRLDELVEEYLVAKAQAEVAESGFRRTEKLKADDIVSERRFVEERGRHLETNARYQHVREKLLGMGLTAAELAELEREHHPEGHRATLRAPIAGIVVAQHVVRGQGVAPGSELFEIVDPSRVWVFASLPIEQARYFAEGDVGTIVPTGGEPITAPLTYLAPVADEATRTVRVRFEVDNREGRLKPREYVDVGLSRATAAALAVPTSALTMVGKVRGVFVERGEGYGFAPVEVGREGGGWAEIVEGLAAGDSVVTDGVFDLKALFLKQTIQSGEDR